MIRAALGWLFRIWGAASLLGLALCAGLMLCAGWWLPVNDAPGPADAIVIMGGDARRSAHGADLYLAGYAPAVYVARPFYDPPEPLCELGLPCPREEDVVQTVLDIKGVPRAATRLYGRELLSTVEEAEALARALPPEAKTILVVTSPSHCRRALAVLRHELPGRTILMSPTPHERFEPKWWTHQASAKAVVLELAKFAQYYAGTPFRTGGSGPTDADGKAGEADNATGVGGQDASENAGKGGADAAAPKNAPTRTENPPQGGADGSRGASAL